MKKRQPNHRVRRAALFLALLFVLLSLSSLPIAAVPEAPNLPDYSHAQAVILYNLDHREILLESNADKSLFPASTVKIMTGLLASQLLAERMDEAVTLTEEMLAGASGNRMNLTVGETIRIRDLYYGAITGGYNDACTALAVLSSGSVDAFVSQMNDEATVLGMYGTLYKNPTGLHSSAMVTTARDTLTLSLAASTDELYMDAASTVKYEIPATNKNAARSFYNRNYLIASAVTTAYHNPYAEGLNAGVTDEGGWCVSAKAYRNDLSWFCVVLGGEEDAESGELYAYSIANNLLSWAARGYTVKTVAKADAEYATIPVRYAAITEEVTDGLPLVAKNDLSVFIPQNTAEGESGLEYTVRLNTSSLEAPIEVGTEVGVLIVTWNGTEVGRVPLLAKSSVTRNEFTYALSRMKELPKNRFFQGFSVSFLVLFILYAVRASRFGYRRRLHSKHYVPVPFREKEDDAEATTHSCMKAPPPDPYASAATELEKKKRRK